MNHHIVNTKRLLGCIAALALPIISLARSQQTPSQASTGAQPEAHYVALFANADENKINIDVLGQRPECWRNERYHLSHNLLLLICRE